MIQGALAHYCAEALLNVPRVLASLQLLGNPMGFLTSLSAGLADLLGLPAAAILAGSPSQVTCRIWLPPLLPVCAKGRAGAMQYCRAGHAGADVLCVVRGGERMHGRSLFHQKVS